VPTNAERREAAQRQLEQQLERSAQRERRQRLLTVIGAVTAIAVAVGAIAFFVFKGNKHDEAPATAAPKSGPTDLVRGGPDQLPAFKAPADLGANCQYPAGEKAAKQIEPPKTGKVPTDPAKISVSMATNQGNIGLWLNNAEAPCTVNSFASLAQKGFFDGTVCHRLTTAPGLGVLQCGDPTGTGTGGPGYKFANEYPTNQYPKDDPALSKPVLYPRGTLAMANSGPDTNGSQFFLVYKDSQLPPNYTVFGSIDATGLATLDKIADAKVEGGGDDCKP
jgi:peptidyl-prolyl cis-trans isomerase B (cyclophilin B)